MTIIELAVARIELEEPLNFGRDSFKTGLHAEMRR